MSERIASFATAFVPEGYVPTVQDTLLRALADWSAANVVLAAGGSATPQTAERMRQARARRQAARATCSRVLHAEAERTGTAYAALVELLAAERLVDIDIQRAGDEEAR